MASRAVTKNTDPTAAHPQAGARMSEAHARSHVSSTVKSGRDGGFTLFELLVSLVLAGLLMAAMPGAIRLGARALGQAEVLTDDAADHATLDFVAERVAETMALYERGADGRLRVAFSGAKHAMGFVAPATMNADAEIPAGVFLFQLALVKSDTPVGRLMLRWQPFRTGLATAAETLKQERVLLSNITELTFRYFGAPTTRSEAAWSDVWSGTDNIPELVELQIRFAGKPLADPFLIRVPLRLRPIR
jgi:prepilin-type N-terminal cleavage/methylation domain-containing protein